MANTFQITISATDKATAIVRRVNESIAKFTRPIDDVRNASARLGKELGVSLLGKSLTGVSKAAADVGEKMSRIIAPLAAIVGVGSIAAVGELAKKWGELGAEIGRTSATIGVSTGDLQALRGAAQLSGVSAESLTGGLKSLGDTMQDALYGRNQDALAMMNNLGIQMKHNADGAVDTTAAFSDLAESIASIKNPQVQGLVARTFGLEAMLPLLRKGKAGIAELTDQMRRSGAIMSGPALAAATAFQQSMAYMDISMGSLKNTIGSALLPIMHPFIEKITAWTVANKGLIATKFAEVAQGIANAISSIDWDGVVQGVGSFCSGVKSAVDFVGGWKNALIGVAIVMNGSLIASVINLGLALGKLSFATAASGIWLVSAGIPALMLKMALLTESALPALSGAFLAVGAAIEATPVGWIITAIAGIGIAGYELVKHWDDIKHWWHRLWGGMGDDANMGSRAINDATGAASHVGQHFARAGRGGNWVNDAVAGADAHAGQHYQRAGRSGSWVPNVAPVAPAAVATAPAWAMTPAAAVFAATASTEGPDSNRLLALVRKLENSGEKSVSPAGAVGRYQIMPNTARQYGFDPSRLTDPKYNETVAQSVLRDLQKKYGNDDDAILTGYNGGPGRANQFLAAGRNPAVLPRETQNYLAHSHQLLAQTGPAVATPYAAAPSQLQEEAAKMGITTSPPATVNQPMAQGQQIQSAGQGAVTVEISFANAPAGMKSRVQTKGPVIVNTKIGYSLPGIL